MCLRALIFKLLDSRARLAARPSDDRPPTEQAASPPPDEGPPPEGPPSEREISDRIARRAYEFYEQRGYAPGYDVEDWERAEAEIRAELADR